MINNPLWISLFYLVSNEQYPFQRQFDSIGNIHCFQERIDSFKIIVIPRLVSSEYLENLGFHPSGDQYWVFEILDVESENRTEYIKNYVSEHGGMKMKPYIQEH